MIIINERMSSDLSKQFVYIQQHSCPILWLILKFVKFQIFYLEWKMVTNIYSKLKML